VAFEGISTADTAPATITEQVLAGIWSGVLGQDSIGMHDNFFAVGGHSLLVVRAVNRMREAFSLVIPLSLVFECPTVASAAGRVEALVLADIQALSDDEVEARLTAGRRR
jgi:acyl carrier protein